MKSYAATPEEFFTALPGREPDLRRLDQIVKEEAPHLERCMVDGMLGYGMFHYKYASGREGDWPVIAIANQKHHIGLYVCAVESGTYLAERYAATLGKVSTGKSCIRIKRLEDADEPVLRQLLREAAGWHSRQPKSTK